MPTARTRTEGAGILISHVNPSKCPRSHYANQRCRAEGDPR